MGYKIALKPQFKIMDQLPIELIFKILNELPLDDLLKCRVLSKKYQFNIDNVFNLNQLSISIGEEEDSFIDRSSFWLDDYKSINTNNLIAIKENSLKLSIFKENKCLNGIQKLFIDCGYSKIKIKDFINFKFINYLIELKTLVIKGLYLNDEIKIELPNLINLGLYELNKKTIELCCPKLRYLNCFQLDDKLIHHFESIEYIKLEYLGDCRFMCKFSNLIKLYLNLDDSTQIQQSNLLYLIKNFTKLNELILEINQIKNDDLNELIKYSKSNKKLNIFINGLLIDANNLILIKFNNKLDNHNLKVYLDNYSLLSSELLFIRSIDYNIWQSFSNHKLETKLKLIEMIEISNSVNDLNRLINFLINFTRIFYLVIRNSSLDSKFYNNLHLYTPSIKQLTIDDSTKQIDFNFISNLNNLNNLKINHNLEFNLIKQIWFHSKRLRNLTFLYDNQLITIKKLDKRFETEKKEIQIDMKLKLFIDYLDDYFKIKNDLYFHKFIIVN